MALSSRDIMKVLPPLKIKVPATAGGGKAKKANLVISHDIQLRFRGFEAQRAGKVRGFEATLIDFCRSYLGLA
jgi:hypothetical protein